MSEHLVTLDNNPNSCKNRVIRERYPCCKWHLGSLQRNYKGSELKTSSRTQGKFQHQDLNRWKNQLIPFQQEKRA